MLVLDDQLGTAAARFVGTATEEPLHKCGTRTKTRHCNQGVNIVKLVMAWNTSSRKIHTSICSMLIGSSERTVSGGVLGVGLSLLGRPFENVALGLAVSEAVVDAAGADGRVSCWACWDRTLIRTAVNTAVPAAPSQSALRRRKDFLGSAADFFDMAGGAVIRFRARLLFNPPPLQADTVSAIYHLLVAGAPRRTVTAKGEKTVETRPA